MAIVLKTKEQIESMRAAGRVVRKVLEQCRELCQPGMTTGEVDRRALDVIEGEGAVGLFKGYRMPGVKPFPSNLCISVNEVVVHGIGDDRVLKDGDIVGADCGVKLNGWCGDAAETFMVGNVAPKVVELCEVTQHVLQLAIENMIPGRKWSQVARLMQNYVESRGMTVVRNYVGHGIGDEMHQDPQVPNYVSRDTLRRDIDLRDGMVLAIEPMVNLGVAETVTLGDGWTVVTADRKPSAHYEHTVAIHADGAEALTDGR
jgi:methionyl aminopeptidase